MLLGKKMLWAVLAIVVLAFMPACGGGGGGGGGGVKTPSNNDAGVGSLTFLGSTTPLVSLYFDHYGSDGNRFNIDVWMGSTSAEPGGTPPDGRHLYLEMFFPTSAVTSGTYSWSNTESAGTFSDWSEIILISNGSESYYELTGGTVEIQVSGDKYTISGDIFTNAGPASFYYDGFLSDYPQQEDQEGVGSLTYLGSTSELRTVYFEEFGSNGNSFNIDLFFSPSTLDWSSTPADGRYVYLEMFFSGDAVTSGTYNWSSSESAGTFSDYSDIQIVTNGVVSFHEITSGNVTILKNGDIYTISGDLATIHGAASFYYNGPRSLKPWQ